ncbi:uncharacterized protein [Primulina eburnea]|uniref:uncharacterized protein isoform X1 n=1 Tax=Primulina eburnea TaxID=1245227 RepID=UPI003C6C9091
MFSYFKPKASTSTRDEHSPTNDEISNHDEQYPVKYQRVDSDVCGYVQLDPAKCTPIWQCPVNERDAIRRAYILRGPYQHVMEYPRTKLGEQYRRFQKIWFEQFPWLEYSPNKDAAFCFPCFLFQQKEARYAAFTVDGFRGWKRVNDGKRCALLMHTGSPTSPHNNAVESMSALMNVSGHIDKVMNAQTLEEVKKNRLKLTTTIESIRWLCLQGCALRGNDESSYSKNQEICNVLGRHDLHIKDIRCQGYGGASNMRGSWNGLQALFLRDSPQAYYVHCFAHRLQLALVAAAEKESSIWLFFSKLNSICNLIKASPKRYTELQSAQTIEIATMVATGIRETDTKLNYMISY